MKFKLLPIIALMIINNSSLAQSDTLNRFDASNKKTGWWLVYLDKDLAVTEDTSEAVYSRYSYFEGKFDYFNMGAIGTKKNPVIAPASTHKNSEGIILLDDEYKANYESGQTRFILSAQNGKLKEYKEFYENGTLKTHFDYTASCGDSFLNFCIYQYKKDGSLKSKGTVRTP